jgi:hypothetical protein
LVYDNGTLTTSTAMMMTTITTIICKIFATASDKNLNQFRLNLTRICA